MQKLLVLQTRKNQGLFGKGLTNKSLEKTVGKGENGHNQHFLTFQQCFLLYLTHSHTVTPFDASGKQAF